MIEILWISSVCVQVVADEGVAHLVVGGDLALGLRQQPGLLLRAGDHAHDPFLQLLLVDQLLAAAGGQQRSLVDEIGQVGAREPRRAGGERVQVDLPRQRLALRVHLEDLAAADAVGPVDDDLPVETARPQKRRVEDVRAVRRRDQDHVVLQLEAVHLHQQLVQRLLTLVVATTQTRAAMPADGVDLVDEHDARRRLLGLLEQVTHTRGADADEHLDEIGAGDGEERHPRLARHRAREQRLAGARRAVEQHTLRDPARRAPETSSGSRGTP